MKGLAISVIVVFGLAACGGSSKPVPVADVCGDMAVGEIGPDTVPTDTPAPEDTPPEAPDTPPDTPYQVPEGCCDTAADCDEDQLCFITDAPVYGVCIDIPEEGSMNCWENWDCPSGECRDAMICPCGMDCVHDMGWCLLEGCCAADADCIGGEACVFTDGAIGVCKPELIAEYACWQDGDCEFGLCEGAVICPCDALCDVEDKPGTCAAPPVGCCLQDDDCEDLWECVFSAGFPGVCKEPPAEGLCWSATDCAYGDCVGAQVCPCDADCDMEDIPGWCTTEFPGCCFEDHHCPGAQYCADLQSGMGMCKDPPAAGACWEDADCSDGFCAGADICPCNHDCFIADQIGFCSDLLPGCCLSVDDCEAGQVCALPGWEDTVGTCKDPVQGHCWSDADCPDGGTCDDVILCPCGALCFVEDSPGVCTEP